MLFVQATKNARQDGSLNGGKKVGGDTVTEINIHKKWNENTKFLKFNFTLV